MKKRTKKRILDEIHGLAESFVKTTITQYYFCVEPSRKEEFMPKLLAFLQGKAEGIAQRLFQLGLLPHFTPVDPDVTGFPTVTLQQTEEWMVHTAISWSCRTMTEQDRLAFQEELKNKELFLGIFKDDYYLIEWIFLSFEGKIPKSRKTKETKQK